MKINRYTCPGEFFGTEGVVGWRDSIKPRRTASPSASGRVGRALIRNVGRWSARDVVHMWVGESERERRRAEAFKPATRRNFPESPDELWPRCLLQLSAIVDGIYAEHGHTAGSFTHLASDRLLVGGGADARSLQGAKGINNFVGCLRKVSEIRSDRRDPLYLSRFI